jgi:NTE family protein
LFRNHAEPIFQEIDDFFDYNADFFKTILESNASEHLHSDNWQQMVYIDTLSDKTTEIELSEEKKEALTRSGRECMEKYFDWNENPADVWMNNLQRPCSG